MLNPAFWALPGIAVIILAGAATAGAGPIAFLGLAAPHLARLMTGADHKWVLPYSALLAALLITVADTLGRVIPTKGEISASGAIFQSVSRNALGSPDVIGFTTGAATGAILQIVVFQASALQVSLGALAGGLATALVVYLLSLKGGVTGGYRLVLVGIGVGAIMGALNGMMLVLGNLDNVVSANLWLAGSLQARTWSEALPVMIGTLLVLPLVLLIARRAALMEMGDEIAQQLGVRVERTRVWLMVLAVLLDEPTTFLDVAHQLEVLELCRRLNREEQRTMVLVLHDLNQAARFADHLIVMKDGALAAAGKPEDIMTEQLVDTVFGLQAKVMPDPVFGTPMVVPVSANPPIKDPH